MPNILVLYYSRTGNTEKMAEAVAEGVKAVQGVEVELNYHVSPESLSDFDAIAVGVPTYHHDMAMDIKNLWEEAAAKSINLKGKIGVAFGSYGWSGEAPRLVLEIMKNRFEMQTIEPPLLIKYAPNHNGIEKCRDFGKKIAKRLMHGAQHVYQKGGKMLDSKEELIKFMKAQIQVENQIVNSLNNTLVDMKNPPVRGVLKGISLDSVKHAEMYTSAVELLTGVPQALTQEHLDKQKAVVEKHIQMEAELIQKINNVLPSIENEKVKLLLNAILEDEKRHHRLLKMVLDILVRGETITEDDWWDILWKNVPFHGAPGG